MNYPHGLTDAPVALQHARPGSARALWSRAVVSMFALLVSACGGGGGSGAVDVPVPVVTTPVVKTSPASVSVAVGGQADFTVVASGNGLGYTWLRSTNNGLSFLEVPGGTSARYTIAAVDATMNGDQYRVIVSNPLGFALSTPATLTVTGVAPTAPVITSQPPDPSALAGANVNLTVAATGASLTYRWQRSADGTTWSDVPGATTATLALSGVTLADAGAQFRVTVANGAGSVTSRVATLTVTAGGGGGGGGGVPAACVPANVLPVGMVVRSTSAIETGGVPGTPQTATMTVVGPATFQGRAVFETRIDTTGTMLPGVTRTFSTWDAASRQLTPWGLVARYTSGITTTDITSVARQPAQYPVYALAVGQSAAVTTVSDTSIVYTINGMVGGPATGMETQTITYTFLGTETITVPAGTFLTCKLRQQAAGETQATTTWLMAGYGATVKFIAGTTTQTLTAITVNGVPLAQFP